MGLEAAPYAADPVCATVLFATPDAVGGIDRGRTTAQATTAWGREVTLRCGLEPPPPSTDRCITVGGVDWLSLDASDPRVPDYARSDAWTFLTYGRTPAIEVVISSAAVGEGSVTDLLAQFTPAVEAIEADRACVGLLDAPLVSGDEADPEGTDADPSDAEPSDSAE